MWDLTNVPIHFVNLFLSKFYNRNFGDKFKCTEMVFKSFFIQFERNIPLFHCARNENLARFSRPSLLKGCLLGLVQKCTRFMNLFVVLLIYVSSLYTFLLSTLCHKSSAYLLFLPSNTCIHINIKVPKR